MSEQFEPDLPQMPEYLIEEARIALAMSVLRSCLGDPDFMGRQWSEPEVQIAAEDARPLVEECIRHDVPRKINSEVPDVVWRSHANNLGTRMAFSYAERRFIQTSLDES